MMISLHFMGADFFIFGAFKKATNTGLEFAPSATLEASLRFTEDGFLFVVS